jgi:hypothetical protein
MGFNASSRTDETPLTLDLGLDYGLQFGEDNSFCVRARTLEPLPYSVGCKKSEKSESVRSSAPSSLNYD